MFPSFKIRTYIVLFLGSFSVTFLNAQDLSLFQYEHFVQDSNVLNYRILYPKNFDTSKQYPLILFLHGRGESGDDNESQLIHGGKLFLDNYNSEAFPCIVVVPQCPKDDYWSNVKRDYSKPGLDKFKFRRMCKPTNALKSVIALMDNITKNTYIKKDQIYVGGLSMGGMGTFDILKWRADMFAAAFPICGGGHPKSVKKYADKVAFWIFHGGEDDVVHPYFSLSMLTALQKQRADVKLTYFEHDNHNSWDSTFAESQLLPWLFSKSKTLTNEKTN